MRTETQAEVVMLGSSGVTSALVPMTIEEDGPQKWIEYDTNGLPAGRIYGIRADGSLEVVLYE